MEDVSAKVEEDTPTVSVTTRSKIRRVRFADRPHEVPKDVVDKTFDQREEYKTTSDVNGKQINDDEFEAKPRKKTESSTSPG